MVRKTDACVNSCSIVEIIFAKKTKSELKIDCMNFCWFLKIMVADDKYRRVEKIEKMEVRLVDGWRQSSVW